MNFLTRYIVRRLRRRLLAVLLTALAGTLYLPKGHAQTPDLNQLGATASDTISRLSQLSPGATLNLPTSATAFLQQVQGMYTSASTRDLAALGLQAARLGLQIEEIKINFLNSQMCNGTPAIPVPPQYSEHLAAGCKLLGLHRQVNAPATKRLTAL